jgi:hypothetical protein
VVSCSGVPVSPRSRSDSSLILSDQYYYSALEALEQHEVHESLLLLLKSLEKDPHNSAAKATWSRVVGNLNAEPVYSREEIKKGTGLDSPLYYFLTFRGEDEQFAVSGMPVRFLFSQGDGSLTGHDITDRDGIARCYVEEIRDFHRAVTITGTAFVEGPAGEHPLEGKTVSFVFGEISPLDQPQRVFAYFGRHATGERFRFLSEELDRVLTGSGFTDLEFNLIEDGYLFNRAWDGNDSTLTALSAGNPPASVLLVEVEQVSLVQRSVDFHLAVMSVGLRYFEPDSQELFTRQMEARGAGSSESDAVDQAFRGAVNQLTEDLNERLDEYRRRYGI